MTNIACEEQAVTIAADDGMQMSGTAVVPLVEDSFAGALLLSGSGPLDRDSNVKGQVLDVSSTLAAALGSVGVASLRFDKRGVARSSGDFTSTGFDLETTDAAAAYEALRGLDGMDHRRVGVVGHSIGATIGARLAAGASDVAFAVLLGCAASPGTKVMAWQTERIALTLPGPAWTLGRLFRWKQRRDLMKLDASASDVVRIGRKDQPARWMREYRAYDPLADLAEVRCPVLAITGRKDIQVNADELVRIQSAVMGPCSTLAPRDLTHVLRASTEKPSITHYPRLLRQPVDSDLIETIVSWTIDHTKRPEASDG